MNILTILKSDTDKYNCFQDCNYIGEKNSGKCKIDFKRKYKQQCHLIRIEKYNWLRNKL